MPVFTEYYPIYATPPDPLSRDRVSTPLSLGIRSMDALITCGIGQRIGVFAGAGRRQKLLAQHVGATR